MRILGLSSVFPNSLEPEFGIFVRERMARVAKHCEIGVVAPVAWFPFNRLLRGRDTAMIPAYELQDNLPVYHPKFVSIPGILKCRDWLFYFLSILPLIWRIRQN